MKKGLEIDFYKTKENINVVNTSFYLSWQYNSLGLYEKAMETLREVMGNYKMNKYKNKKISKTLYIMNSKIAKKS